MRPSMDRRQDPRPTPRERPMNPQRVRCGPVQTGGMTDLDTAITATGTDADGSGDAGDDIRLLGRLIGDVLREQAGAAAFDLVERVRQVAVTERRDGNDPVPALAAELADAGLDDQVHLIRAFGWLSLLANTAEDMHQERRRRYHRDAGTGSQRRQPRGEPRTPPRERRRRGDRRRDARFARRVAGDHRPPHRGATQDRARPRRRRRRAPPAAGARGREPERDRRDRRRAAAAGAHAVADRRGASLEAARARRDQRSAAYYRSSIFAVVPAIAHDIERLTADRLGTAVHNPQIVSMGSWIGGDRDGNPYVTAPVLRLAVESHAPVGPRAPPHRAVPAVARAVDVRPAGHAHRCARRARRGRPATTRRSAPTSRTGAPCGASMPGCGRWPRWCSTRCPARSPTPTCRRTRARPSSSPTSTS